MGCPARLGLTCARRGSPREGGGRSARIRSASSRKLLATEAQKSCTASSLYDGTTHTFRVRKLCLDPLLSAPERVGGVAMGESSPVATDRVNKPYISIRIPGGDTRQNPQMFMLSWAED